MLYQTENPHGGDVGGDVLDFSSNINPFGMPPRVAQALHDAVNQAVCYPDPYCRALTAAIAAHERLAQEWVLCGAGAAELIYAYCAALRPSLAAELAPTFCEYAAAASHVGARSCRQVLRAPEFLPDEELLLLLSEQKPDVLFLCSPNNPTGRTIPRELLLRVLDLCAWQGTGVLLDECFLDFTQTPSAKTLLAQYPNLLIVKALTKNYALAGVRVGYCLTADTTLLKKMAAASPPWNVSVFAQAAGVAALQETGELERMRLYVEKERAYLTAGLQALGFTVCPSEANYLLFHAPVGLDTALRQQKIAIRTCENYAGLTAGWYRIAVRLHEENETLLCAMRRVMEERLWH